MSDLTLPREIVDARVRPLPASSYFDPALFAREMETLFQHGHEFVPVSCAPSARISTQEPPRERSSLQA